MPILPADLYGYSFGTDEYINAADGPFGARYLGHFSSDPNDGAWWFLATGIPQGATLTLAELSLELEAGDYAATPQGALFAFDVDNPAGPNAADVHRISAHAALTTASVAANLPNANPFVSASLLAVLQEVVDRPGFSGNLTVVWVSTGSSNSEWFQVGDVSLEVEWDTGGSTPQVGGGTVTPTGTLRNLVRRASGGSVTPSTTLVNDTGSAQTQVGGGSVTPSTELDITVFIDGLGASVQPTGTLRQRVFRASGGVLTPGATLRNLVRRASGGSVTPGATLSQAGGGGGSTQTQSLSCAVQPGATLSNYLLPPAPPPGGLLLQQNGGRD